jgi:hypothetical protein
MAFCPCTTTEMCISVASTINHPHMLRDFANEDSAPGLVLVEEDVSAIALAGVIPMRGLEPAAFLPLAL